MYADVLVQYGVKSLDRTFTYHIPNELIDELDVGMKVYVPFGKSKINGFVVNIKEKIDSIYEVKDIIGIVNRDFKLNSELLSLGREIQKETLCSLITAYQTMLPTSLKVNNSKEDYKKYKVYIELTSDLEKVYEYQKNNKVKKQLELIELLKNGRVLKSEINGSSLKKLIENGIVYEKKEMEYRIHNNVEKTCEFKLTPEQENARLQIYESFNTSKVFLLHGITGSGKTEIYMHLISDAIKLGKTAIMLVPEISLTTQIVKRFYSRFGSNVAIFHSSLSDGEKYDEYKKILNGEVSVVVGTRSAIFTPLKNLGIIIIDEEHSANYKQENNPKYHALDIAKWRSEYNLCPVVLGSATPSLESMARAKKGVYTYISLKSRIGSSKLPSIKIVDMKPELKKHNLILSEELQINIMKTLERNEQVMLLQNRRGYSTTVTCLCCGFTYKCPKCDISLTYHKSNNHLVCHYCGYTLVKDSICPNCKDNSLSEYGVGTEKVEEYLKKMYPSYRILRMDTDTTSKKGMHDKYINAIENHEYDIIIGTQMISKGFDFPNVTLVGVINADESLNIPDFRSGETTFSLLTQVAGRAGRGSKPGSVIIQTCNPENKTLENVIKNDYISNYLYEMNIRHTLNYPPYCYLVLLRVSGKDYETLSKEANKVASYLRNELTSSTILGPTTASVFKINNIYRFQIIIKYKKEDKLTDSLNFIINEYALNKNVSIDIDMNPLKI